MEVYHTIITDLYRFICLLNFLLQFHKSILFTILAISHQFVDFISENFQKAFKNSLYKNYLFVFLYVGEWVKYQISDITPPK